MPSLRDCGVRRRPGTSNLPAAALLLAMAPTGCGDRPAPAATPPPPAPSATAATASTQAADGGGESEGEDAKRIAARWERMQEEKRAADRGARVADLGGPAADAPPPASKNSPPYDMPWNPRAIPLHKVVLAALHPEQRRVWTAYAAMDASRRTPSALLDAFTESKMHIHTPKQAAAHRHAFLWFHTTGLHTTLPVDVEGELWIFANPEDGCEDVFRRVGADRVATDFAVGVWCPAIGTSSVTGKRILRADWSRRFAK